MKKIYKIIIKIITVLISLSLLVACSVWIISKPLPTGKQGKEATMLANKMLDAINHKAWQETNIVMWTFMNRHHHLWDKKRHLARVQWKKFEVYVDINKKSGKAFKSGNPVTSKKENDRLVDKAWKYWVNDSFWLNAPAKVFDNGTVRQVVKLKNGNDGLLINYTSGGNTPGDSYLWVLDENGLPKEWKLWVSIIPIKGIGFTWERWETISTEARISTLHNGLIDIKLSNVKGAKSIYDFFPKSDPFEVLK